MPVSKYSISKLVQVLLVLIIGVLASWGAAFIIRTAHEANVGTQFNSDAKDRINVIRNALEDDMASLRFMVSFFHSSDDVSYSEFTTVANQLLQEHPELSGVSWVPHVMHVDRTGFEANANSDFPGYMIKDLNGGNNMTPAPDAEDYYAIRYVRPITGNEHILGFNLLSNPERQQAIRMAAERGKITASPRVLLLRENASIPGVILFAPVFEHSYDGPEIKLGKVKGVISLGLPFESWVDHAIEPLAFAGTNVIIRDLSMPADNNVMYVKASRLSSMTEAEILESAKEKSPLIVQDLLSVGGRQWQITLLPAKGFYKISSLQAEIVFIVGLIFTWIFAAYVFTVLTQKARIQYEVNERTAELAKAKAQTDLLLNSTNDGVIGLDANGQVTFINPHALELLKFTRQETIGRNYQGLIHRAVDTDAEKVETPIEVALKDGKIHTEQNDVFWRKDGTAFPVEYTCAPMYEGEKITGVVIAFRDISERKIYEQNLQYMAQYDQLTGAANRTLMVDLLAKAMSKAERKGTKVGVIYIDLDEFKAINDNLGHAVGDELLKTFAARTTEVLRTYDTLARIGGDEFIIVVDDITSEGECKRVISRLATAFEHPIFMLGRNVQIKMSIGKAIFPDHAKTVDNLLSHADGEMYKDKKARKIEKQFDTLQKTVT